MRRLALVLAPLAFAAGCFRQAQPAGFVDEGMASFYGPGLNGNLTASGEKFDQDDFTAAHRTLPFGSCLVVENTANRKTVKVRVNDRGPYAKGRLIDLSKAAAKELGMLDRGVAKVRLYRCR